MKLEHIVYSLWIIVMSDVIGKRASTACVFHTIDGLASESDGVRFIRIREDALIGQEIMFLQAYPRSSILIKGSEGSNDHTFFYLTEINSTTVRISLVKSLEDLVDRDVPRNLLKFRIICSAENERTNEGSYMLVTVYIEDVNDNSPEFLNLPYDIEVDENTLPGTIVFNGIQAFDRDKPNTPNSEVHITMYEPEAQQLAADGSPYFALKSPHRPFLELKKQLDFDNGIREFQIVLVARDRGTPSNLANTTVTIRVKDIDDLPPKFTEGVYRSKINEFYPMTGIPTRVPLYFSPPIMAYDQDSLNATLIYDIISGNERKLFRVNSNNGIIFLQKEVDLEEESLPGNTFVLQIEARQKESPLMKTVARIEVEIIDLNDNAPEFETDFYNISIVENLPSGFSVLQVNAIDRDQGENSEFEYQLVEEESSAGAFQIDSRSGWITVQNNLLLDREERQTILLMVNAVERNPPYSDGKNIPAYGLSAVRVDITLLDSNDNTPKFENGNLYEFKVAVGARVGSQIGQIVALDPDEGGNGMMLYELQRPKGSGYIPFSIDAKNGTLFVAGPLKRGRIAVFVEAIDQPANPAERRFSLAVITIEVYATVDDQAIDFVGAPYEFWVGSNVPLGTSVGQVRTTLLYEGEDEIMYDLLHSYSEGVPFAIEERSGIITVIRELEDFNRNVYYFEAIANYLYANRSLEHDLLTARHVKPLTATTSASIALDNESEGVLITNVTIHIADKIENTLPTRTRIEEINMNVIEFHVEENLAGAVIGQLLYKNGMSMGSKNDIGPSMRDIASYQSNLTNRIKGVNVSNHQLSRFGRRILQRDGSVMLHYIIANQQDIANKLTITDDGTLMTMSGLDRETRDKYELTVIVEYSTGVISGAGIYQVNVFVDDVNDNAPQFNAKTFVGVINENSPIGTEISINQPIEVHDADMGKNSEFHIIIQGDDSKLFALKFFNKTATPADNQSQSMNLGLFHMFNLTDQWNDEVKFSGMPALFSASNLGVSAHFQVFFNGKTPLDREKKQIYHLKLIAVDAGGLSNFAGLTVLVVDVNDNAPIFDRISVFKESNIEIREYTTDMEVYFVEKTTLAIREGISLAGSATTTHDEYKIPGSPRLSTDYSFNDTNDEYYVMKARLGRRSIQHQQLLGNKCPLFAIHEDVPLGTKVLQVKATDEDYGRNSEVFYAITNEQVNRSPMAQHIPSPSNIGKHFTMDKISGELMVNSLLPPNAEVFLNLTAKDRYGLSDNTCLRFTIIDVNNHAPTFKKSWYSFDIEEGDFEEYSIGQIIAVDLDYGENANLTYSIAVKDMPFGISPISGVLKVIGTLDREMMSKYNFEVTASDNPDDTFHRLSSSVEVEVNVLDINDNFPEFIGYDDFTNEADVYLSTMMDNNTDNVLALPMYKAYLSRDTKPGAFVKQINAIDKDYLGNGNGLVLFSLVHLESPPLFQIDSRDGTITTVSNFHNYNEYEHFNLTVIASDLGSPTLSSTAVVLINLQGQSIDESEDQDQDSTNISVKESKPVPVLPHKYYEVEIMENNDAPLAILKVNLTEGHQADAYRWSFIDEIGEYGDGFEHFEIDSKSGIVYAVKSFDRELIDTFRLKISVEKINREGRNYPKQTYPIVDERIQGLQVNELRLVVHVLDDNDNAPKFKGNGRPIICVIPSVATFGYPVTTVEATDLDAGLNAEIRYRLLNEPSRIFAIDELTGKIRILAPIAAMNDRVYGFDVKATDRRGADDGRSSIANVFVYVIEETHQVRIVVAGRPVDVERRIEGLTKGLSEAVQMDVRVRMLEPHQDDADEPATDAYIYAVDMRTNGIMDMEELHQSLAKLQLDQLEHFYNRSDQPSSMPRIIELAEFGQLSSTSQKSPFIMSGVEIISITLTALVVTGAAMTTLCFLCLRQKR